MASLISFPNNLFISSTPIDKTLSNHNNGVKMSLLIHPRRQLLRRSFTSSHLVVSIPKESGSLGFSCSFQKSCCCSGLVKRRGKNKVWEGEGDRDLEEEVLKFMKNSRNPDLFPTKEELIIGGRMDLVKSIVKQGGWLSFGWDLDDGEEEEEQVKVQENGFQPANEETAPRDEFNDKFLKNDSRIFQNRFDGGASGFNTLEESEAVNSGVSSLPINGSHPPSSSGRMEGEEDAGIVGILSRLEKERTQSFHFVSKDRESKVHGSWNDCEKGLTVGLTEAPGGESSRVMQSSGNELFDDSGGMHGHSEDFSNCDDSMNQFEPDMWRKWSNRRAGCSEADFEAAEFGEDFIRNDETIAKGTTGNDKLRTIASTGDKLIDIDQIRSRLKYMELELDSVRHLLSYQTNVDVPDKTTSKKSSEDSQSLLSDSSEFRETEIMKARDRLRSLRAHLAVLEGKMALKIVEAQKMVEVKQKRIHYARKALTSLRTHCIIWPKTASEVVLVGSFDGWTTQRKMEQTSPGIFSLYIRLYPGRYEIKFIVDGEWMIDPLRPIANHWGYSNNILIVS